MASITDANLSVQFRCALEEHNNAQLKTYGEIIDTTTELCQFHRRFVKSSLETCLKKCKDDEMLFETMQTFKRDLAQKKAASTEKCCDVSAVTSEIQHKTMQKDDIILKMEKLKEEQNKRKELIESQNKANKARLRNLQKARVVFQEHLGMEIRTILGKTQPVRGEKFQFVFRNINPSNPDSAYVVTMGIGGDGRYQIVSSDPALECLPDLERRLQETNNLSAFLANVRKEFVSKVRG